MMWRSMLLLCWIVAAVLALVGVETALAQQAHPWQIGLQSPVTPVMSDIVWFHNYVMYIITAITLFVLVLLVLVIVKFNARSNPNPTKTTHNTVLEVAWTLVPVLILLAIAVPSFKLLFYQLNIPPADLTIKATGKQWFWSYSYPDQGPFEFDSIMVQEKDRKPDQPRLLAVDNAMVVPVNKIVRVQATASDVIHAFAVPAFGIIVDAIPGRLNEVWFQATREGVYYGQCRELCGKDHAFMPIEVRVVSEQAFATWVDEAKKRWASNATASPTALAAAR